MFLTKNSSNLGTTVTVTFDIGTCKVSQSTKNRVDTNAFTITCLMIKEYHKFHLQCKFNTLIYEKVLIFFQQEKYVIIILTSNQNKILLF